MKTTMIKFPLEHGTLDRPLGNMVFDFLVASIVDGDLELDELDLRSMRVTMYRFESSYEDEGDLYDIFDVEVEGENKAIDTLNSWFEQFDRPLH